MAFNLPNNQIPFALSQRVQGQRQGQMNADSAVGGPQYQNDLSNSIQDMGSPGWDAFFGGLQNAGAHVRSLPGLSVATTTATPTALGANLLPKRQPASLTGLRTASSHATSY